MGALALFVLYGSSGPWAHQAPLSDPFTDVSLPDIAQNVLLYVPFGVFGVWALRGWRPGRGSQFLAVMALALAYSAAMELMQRFFWGRTASPLDIAANVAGTAVGIAVAAPTEHAWAIAVTHIRRTGLLNTPARYLLAALLAAIVVSAWYPFDITLDVSTVSERTRAVRRDPWLWPAASALWMEAARYCLLTVTTVLCLPNLGRRAAPVAVVSTVLIAVVVDLGQLGMGSQPIGLAVFASQAAGAVAGAAAAMLFPVVRGTKYAAA